MANTSLTIEQIRNRAALEGVTLYQLHRLINAAFVEAGRPDLSVRPQKVYNYARQGMVVKGRKITNATEFRMTLAEADAAAQKWITRDMAKKATPVQADSAFSVEDIETTSAELAAQNPTLIDELESIN